MRERFIAAHIADTLVEAFGEDVNAQMACAAFDPLRTLTSASRLQVKTTWDAKTGWGMTSIQMI